MSSSARIVNLGSLNIDRVLRVEHLARPGQTIAARSLTDSAGGKGANQSVALARAGAQVTHIGKVGADGAWLRDKLHAEGIDTRFIRTAPGPTGQALIQVDDEGQNSIVIVAGANAEIRPDEIDAALRDLDDAAWLVVQNETSSVAHAIRAAKKRKLRVALNPAPFDARIREYPLELVDLLCVNESEAYALTGETEPAAIFAGLARELPDCELLLTRGAKGAMHHFNGETIDYAGRRVPVVDTTAAGDTFLGYYLEAANRDMPPACALASAINASALCVTRPGALDSIPRSEDLVDFW
jgi:ribokinase